MSNYEVQLIEIATIFPGEFERPLNLDHVASLARDIQENGLHQPIGVIPGPRGPRRCWGQHRCEAFRTLGRTHVPGRIVDERADELMFSLTENNLRLEESMEAMVTRVTALARRQACTFHDAALQANVNPSKFSRCKKIVAKLSDEAKQFAAAHDLGMSDLYLVASRTIRPKCSWKPCRLASTVSAATGCWSGSRPAASRTLDQKPKSGFTRSIWTNCMRRSGSAFPRNSIFRSFWRWFANSKISLRPSASRLSPLGQRRVAEHQLYQSGHHHKEHGKCWKEKIHMTSSANSG